MANKLVLEVYTDYVCPWCYLCTGRIDKIIQNYSITTQIIHFPLHPDTPEEGMTLEALFFGSSYDFKTAEKHLAKHMDKEGLLYNRPEFTYNSRLAQELAAWAVDAHDEHRIHDALFRAYFVEGMNIAKIDNLIRIAASINLPEHEAAKVLEKRSYQSRIDEDWKRSQNKEITGVPAFVMSDSCVVGAQPYEILKKWFHIIILNPEQVTLLNNAKRSNKTFCCWLHYRCSCRFRVLTIIRRVKKQLLSAKNIPASVSV